VLFLVNLACHMGSVTTLNLIVQLTRLVWTSEQAPYPALGHWSAAKGGACIGDGVGVAKAGGPRRILSPNSLSCPPTTGLYLAYNVSKIPAKAFLAGPESASSSFQSSGRSGYPGMLSSLMSWFLLPTCAVLEDGSM